MLGCIYPPTFSNHAYLFCVCEVHEKTLIDFFQIFKITFNGCTSALNYLLRIKNLTIAKRKKTTTFPNKSK